MTRKAKNYLTLGLGIALIVLAFVMRSQWGMLFLMLLIPGILIALLGILDLSGILGKEKSDRFSDGKVKPQYARREAVLSRVEWEFLQVLRQIVDPKKYEILTQVALHSVIDKVTHTSYRNELFRIIDYVIVDNYTYAPLLLIELNDSSHRRSDRVERDKKVNEICQSANMPIITFLLEDMQDIPNIRKTIQKNALRR